MGTLLHTVYPWSMVAMGDSQNNSCGCKQSGKAGADVNTSKTQEAEAELMTFEGGSDVFTSNRHALHNNEAKSFNFLKFRTEDDAPFFRPSAPVSSGSYVSATIPVEKEGCERVSALILRSNFQWLRHALALTTAGFLVFNVIRWAKSDGERKD